MSAPSPLDRAKAGDADAIATLLNHALGPKGITVRGDRQSSCLVLWLESQTLVNSEWVINTIHRGMERLRLSAITTVQIHYRHPDYPDRAWSKEILLSNAAPIAEPPNAVLPPEPPSAPTPLELAYHTLELEPGASLEALDEAYFRLKIAFLQKGKRKAIPDLKAAHDLIKESLQESIPQDEPPVSEPEEVAEPDPVTAAVEALPALLRSRGLEGQARLTNAQLQIRLEPESAQKPNRTAATIYTLLTQDELSALRMAGISDVVIFGLASPQKVGWRHRLSLPPIEPAYNPDNRDLLSFKNRHINTFGFPVLMLLGVLMNVMPLVNMMLLGVKIWFHELGHATIAWLAGRRALPLPFGWTTVDPRRSLFVYFGLLILFGLLFWAGRREKKRWPMVLAGVLVVLQFWFTWLLPEYRFETLLSFGGVGGELYLCTLLMVSFYFPLPDYWRWDFYRYPVVLGAAFTFWGQFWLWRQIKRGIEDIPWGSMWGGPSDGDMNNLSYAGWSDQQIIGTYTTLGSLCLIALLAVYFYSAIKQNRHALFALCQRFLARG